MSDGVKFIFKTLFKVPVFIFASFFVFNILVFFLTYFKMLGFSYVVMQTAVENNYLPTEELNRLADYAYSLNNLSQQNTCVITWYDESEQSTGGNYMHTGDVKYAKNASTGGYDYIQNNADFADSNGDPYGDASKKKQYGRVSKVGCSCEYTLIWPLGHTEQSVDGEVAGINNSGATYTQKGDAELERMREDKKITIPIRIVYSVPGLKYYPDLINY